MNYGTTKKRLPGLGERVKQLRQRQGLTLQVAAVRGGTTPQTLVQLERHDLATARTLNCVARALGVAVDDLTGRRAGGPVPVSIPGVGTGTSSRNHLEPVGTTSSSLGHSETPAQDSDA